MMITKKNKVLITIFLIIVITFSICFVMSKDSKSFAVVAYAEENVDPTQSIVAQGSWGDNLTWALDNEGTLIVSGEGQMESVNEYTIQGWIHYSGSIKTVKILEGVTSIGSYAFSRCNNLTTLWVPSTLTSVGYHSFHYLSDRKSVV